MTALYTHMIYLIIFICNFEFKLFNYSLRYGNKVCISLYSIWLLRMLITLNITALWVMLHWELDEGNERDKLLHFYCICGLEPLSEYAVEELSLLVESKPSWECCCLNLKWISSISEVTAKLRNIRAKVNMIHSPTDTLQCETINQITITRLSLVEVLRIRIRIINLNRARHS